MIALVLVVALLGAIAVTVVSLLGFLGKLPRNHFAGIRTRYTMSSDERWIAVHREGGPLAVLGGVAAISCGLAFVPFAIAGKISTVLGASIAIVMAALILLSTFMSWWYGTSKARARLG